MRIACILHESPENRLGGVELHVLDMARAFLAAGHAVDCYYPRPGGGVLGEVTSRVVAGVPFHGVAVPVRPDFAARFKDDAVGTAVADLVQAGGCDVVHVHHLIGFTGSLLHTLVDRGLPTLVTAHDSWAFCNQCHLVRADGHLCAEGPETDDTCAWCLLQRVPQLGHVLDRAALARMLGLRRRYLTSALARADAVLAASAYMRRNLERAGVPPQRIHHVPLGVRAHAEVPHRERTGRLRVGSLGTVTFKKGLDILLDAMDRLSEDEVRLEVHGQVIQPDWFAALAPRMDAAPNIAYCGAYGPEDVPQILAGLDVVVVPSREESYCLVLREAFQAGVPVVASAIPALAEAAEEGAGAAFFPCGDAGALARVLELLARDAGALAALRRAVPTVPTVDDTARQVLALARTLVRRARTSS